MSPHDLRYNCPTLLSLFPACSHGTRAPPKGRDTFPISFGSGREVPTPAEKNAALRKTSAEGFHLLFLASLYPPCTPPESERQPRRKAEDQRGEPPGTKEVNHVRTQAEGHQGSGNLPRPSRLRGHRHRVEVRGRRLHRCGGAPPVLGRTADRLE